MNKIMSVSATFSNSTTSSKRMVISYIGIVALLFMLVLQFQMLRTIEIDAYNGSITRIELMGFAMGHALGAILFLRLLSQGQVLILPFYIAIMLIFYIALVVYITKPDYSLLALLLSRNGIFNWFLLGLGTAGMVDVFYTSRRQNKALFLRRIAIISLGIIALMALKFTFDYMNVRTPDANYQPMAYGLIIFTIFTFAAIETLWGNEKPLLLLIAFIGISSLMVAVTMLANSTIIAVYWILFLLIIFWNAIINLSLPRKILLLIATVGFFIWFFNSEIFNDILVSTRVSELVEDDISNFSSFQNRLEILPSFGIQFAVSPFFGNFRAEIISGAGDGYYIHSLPLSFLTHSGMIGFLLISITLCLVMRKRIFANKRNKTELQYGWLMLAILFLGTLGTTLTWIVFWFMLGFLCRRPASSELEGKS